MTCAVSLLVTILMAIMGFQTFSFFEKQFEKTISQQQFKMVSAMAEEIDSKIEMAQKTLIEISLGVSPQILDKPEQLQQFLDNQLGSRILFDNGLLFYLPSGVMVAESPLEAYMVGQNYSHRDYIQKTLETRKPYISQPFLSTRPHRHPIVQFTVPLFDRHGEMSIILAGSIDLLKDNALGKIARISLGEKGYLSIFNTDRTIIMHPQRSRILQKISLVGNDLQQKALTGFEGTGKTATAITSFKRLQFTNWILEANYPQEEAYAPLFKAKKYFIAGTYATVILSLLTVWLLMRRLTGRLTLFTQHVKTISAQDETFSPFQSYSKDEIGELARAFDNMMARLAEQKIKLHTLSSAVEQSPSSLMICNRDGIIEYVNPSFTSLTGYRPDEVIGKFQYLFRPDPDLEHKFRDLYRAIKDGADWHGESTSLKKNGQRYFWAGSISPIKNLNSEITHIVEIKEDITTRKIAEESEHRSRFHSEAMTEAIIRFLKSGDVCQMSQLLVERCVAITNASLGFLYDLDDRGNARFMAISGDLLTNMKQHGIIERIKQQIASEGSYLVPKTKNLIFAPIDEGKTLLLNDCQPHCIWPDMPEAECSGINSFLGVPLRLGDKTIGLIGLINQPGGFTAREQQEVEAFAQAATLSLQSAYTELARKQVSADLQQAQKMEAIGQLAGGIAHDFNNLLTIINGYSNLLMRSMNPDSQIYADVGSILEAGELAAQLTRKLLAFGRRQILTPEIINPNALILSVEKLLHRLIREDIEICLTQGTDIVLVKADPGQLEQILINLVVNARDAIKGPGTISISTANTTIDSDFVQKHPDAAEGEYIQISVSDTGEGIPKEIRQRIFEPFFTTKEPGRGTGLGLATVYGIIKQSGGYISVDSVPELGTTFNIYLPQVEAEEHPDIAEKSPQIMNEKKRIMVVEDEIGVRSLIKQILVEYGFNVHVAENPIDALNAIANGEQIDLLVTDIIMPQMNGIQLVEELSALTPELKVIFISGYNQFNDLSSAEFASPNRAFLQKPFNPESLITKIRQMLA